MLSFLIIQEAIFLTNLPDTFIKKEEKSEENKGCGRRDIAIHSGVVFDINNARYDN